MIISLVVLLLAQADVDAGAEVVVSPPPEIPVAVAAPVQVAPPAEIKPAHTATEIKLKFGQGVTVSHGDFSLNLRGRVQVQALSIFAGSAPATVRQNAIQVRRARIALKAGLPYKLSMNLQLAFANLDMESDAPNVLRDFNVEWKPLRDLSVRIGQGKVPFDVQRVVSSSSLQMVDRSIVTGEMNLDRDVGISLFSDDLFGLNERLKYTIGIFGGDGRNRIGTDNGLLYAGRIRFSFFGPIDDKVEGDPERKSNVRLAVGVAAAQNISTNRPRSTTGTPFTAAHFDYTHVTGDLHFKWSGISLLSQIFYRNAATDSQVNVVKGSSVTEYSRSGIGYFVQAGGYANSWLEFTGRFGELIPRENTDPSFKRQREIGGGFNLMFEKHDLKVQTDYFYLDDGAGGNSRHQIRLQAQVYF
jgi:phosphate-selective porin OprO and OprP